MSDTTPFVLHLGWDDPQEITLTLYLTDEQRGRLVQHIQVFAACHPESAANTDSVLFLLSRAFSYLPSDRVVYDALLAVRERRQKRNSERYGVKPQP